MKKLLSIIIIVLSVASCQESQKIGFVDNSVLINDYQEKKDIEANLKGKIEVYEKRRDSLSQAFQLDVKAAEVKARSMSQANLQKLQQEFQQKEQIISQQLQFEQQQIAQESQSKNDSLIKKVRDFVKDYGKTNGYSFILGSNEAGSVMYGTEEVDLTQTILDALNEAYKKK
ncbi:OmpH family outer membrane protein [Flavobacteriaceae bacterium S0825]|uniref:OmpH family outer membrane protein n=1 Tax=Gaetbulibacter sp. S0825 TaxID=2720084 RepID=UPI001430A79D|nr:OmpH family outer membrane protein [Gaetbulibacter sp. S0825]MCK0108264.1 OmpH family outer membrane protein [Flavobacteriaceae bacterium S0825]NIX63900.1 OmpH family outer membrane protein [Gaetbulibacter sp. S0825]